MTDARTPQVAAKGHEQPKAGAESSAEHLITLQGQIKLVVDAVTNLKADVDTLDKSLAALLQDLPRDQSEVHAEFLDQGGQVPPPKQ